jgi:PAS domain S-box-containing protein
MKKIMIVEDEAVIALRLEQRVAEMGYEVIGTSYTGEDSMKKARSLLPDLILMDVMISGDLDGIDAAKIVKDELDIPVIFMTAYTEDQIIERAKEVEPYGYIIKPIRERELKATIEIALYKKKMEKRLQESEEKYRQLFETISDAIIIFDGETRKIIDVNDSCLSMYGYSKDEFLKLRLHDITAEPEKSEKAIKHAILGETQKIPLRYHKRNDGTIFPVEINSGTFSLEDRIVVCGVIRDISIRKQAEKTLRKSEKRYRAVVESQSEMICRFLPDGTLTFVNDAYCRYFDKGREELIGHKFFPLIHDSDRDKVFESITSLNPNTPAITHEHRVLAPDGKICWHKWTNRAIFDDKSALVEYQAIGWDITDRKRTEESLRKAHDELERRVKERT